MAPVVKSEVKKKKLFMKMSRLSVHDRLQKKMGDDSEEESEEESDAEVEGRGKRGGGDIEMPGI